MTRGSRCNLYIKSVADVISVLLTTPIASRATNGKTEDAARAKFVLNHHTVLLYSKLLPIPT